MKSLVYIRTALASLALAAAIGGSVANAAPSDGQTVNIDNLAFAPGDVTIPAGSTLAWTNLESGVPHTTTSLDGVWDSGVLATGASFSQTFAQAGDFAYQCSIHPSMRGVIHVTDSATANSVPAATSGY
jgi:plastocyanin